MFKTIFIAGLIAGVYCFCTRNTTDDYDDSYRSVPDYMLDNSGENNDLATTNSDNIFDECGNKYGLNRQQKTLLYGLVHQESQFNPNAVNGQTGATGVAQYLPRIAAQKGFDPYDPAASICHAAKDFSNRIRRGYSDEQAVMAHFGGDSTRLWKRKTLNYCHDVFGKSRIDSSNCRNEFYALKEYKNGNQYAYND